MRFHRSLCLATLLLAGCGDDDGNASGTTTGSGGSTAVTSGAGPNGSGSASGTGSGGGSERGVAATPVGEFLSSIGACTHIGQGVDSASESATALAFAGIRNVRDDGNPAHVDDWILLQSQAGVKTCLLTNHDVDSTLDMAKQLHAAGALLAVEGANEPNNFAVTYEGETSDYNGSFMPVAKLQRDLYAAVKGDPELAGIPVFHTSEAGGSEPDNVGLQYLTIPAGAGADMPDGTAYADFANTHNYVTGHSHALADNAAWNAEDPTLNGDWDGLWVEYGHTWHGGYEGYSEADLETLPRVTTETGWTTSGDGAISEDQQGRLFLDLYLSAFKRGWSYTFVYMLRDDPGQGYWGFFDTDYQPKASGTYLHNMTTILADDGAGSNHNLDYTVASPPETVHDLLLVKTDGTFELVVWGERIGGSDVVTVSFAKAHSTVKIYDPTTGTDPTDTKTDASSVTLELSDHPLILELGPGS